MKKFALVAAGLALAFTPALADNTDQETVTVSGTIVASLDATVNNSLTMPHLVKPSATGSEVTGVSVACGDANADNVVGYTGNGNPFAAGNSAAASGPTAGNNLTNHGGLLSVNATGDCATVTVTGEANYHFGVATAVVTSPANMTLSNPLCYVGGAAVGATGVANATGTKVLKCGATITANNASAASYSGAGAGSFTVTVTYD